MNDHSTQKNDTLKQRITGKRNFDKNTLFRGGLIGAQGIDKKEQKRLPERETSGAPKTNPLICRKNSRMGQKWVKSDCDWLSVQI